LSAFQLLASRVCPDACWAAAKDDLLKCWQIPFR
jgi:hypothetical protein